MTSRAIVAFGDKEEFLAIRPNGTVFYNKLPSGLKSIVDRSKGHTYFWVSLGPEGQYYIGWRRKDGTEFYELGDQTVYYGELNKRLESADSLEKIKVVFGPIKGGWVLITADKEVMSSYSLWPNYSLGIPADLHNDIKNTVSQGRQHPRGGKKPLGVRHVAVGASGSWVVVYRDGSVSSDLKNQYGDLQRILDDLIDGDLRGVFVNPFNSTQYVIGYKNGEKSIDLPLNLSCEVSFGEDETQGTDDTKGKKSKDEEQLPNGPREMITKFYKTNTDEDMAVQYLWNFLAWELSNLMRAISDPSEDLKQYGNCAEALLKKHLPSSYASPKPIENAAKFIVEMAGSNAQAAQWKSLLQCTDKLNEWLDHMVQIDPYRGKDTCK